MGKKNKSRYGTPSDIARLDFHNWFGQLQDRIKAKTTEKDKGISMIQKIYDYFGISEEFCRKRMRELNEEAMQPTEIPKEMKKKQDKFTRDEKGNIVSPFGVKK